MLCQQSSLLHLNQLLNSGLLHSLSFGLLQLLVSLSPIQFQLLLPELLDVPLVFGFTHASPVLIHLLELLILSKLLHQLHLELLLDPLFLECPFNLQLHRMIFGFLKLPLLSILLGIFLPHTLLSLLFALFEVKLIPKIFLELLFGSPFEFLLLKLLEDHVSCGLHLIFGSLDLIQTGLLLLGVASHHLILVSFHLLGASNQCLFFIMRQDHVSLCLLLFQSHDSCRFTVLLDHPLHDCIDLVTLLQVLHLGISLFLLHLSNLSLKVMLVDQHLLQLFSVFFSSHCILKFFHSQLSHIKFRLLFL